MKQNANRMRVDKEYEEGEAVYLKLQLYRQSSIALRRSIKLTLRYYEPFKILARVGPVSYSLQVLEGSRIHLIFHVSLLKREATLTAQVSPNVPLVGEEGQLLAQPEKILDRRVVRKENRAATQVLVIWSNLDEADATWEDYWNLKSQYPDFDP